MYENTERLQITNQKISEEKNCKINIYKCIETECVLWMDGYIKNSSEEINMYSTLYLLRVSSPSFMRDHFYAMCLCLCRMQRIKEKFLCTLTCVWRLWYMQYTRFTRAWLPHMNGMTAKQSPSPSLFLCTLNCIVVLLIDFQCDSVPKQPDNYWCIFHLHTCTLTYLLVQWREHHENSSLCWSMADGTWAVEGCSTISFLNDLRFLFY